MLPLANRRPVQDAHDYCVDEGWVSYVNMMNNPNEDDYLKLLRICNEVTCLLNMGFGEPIPDVANAHDGLVRILKRSRETGSYAMDAELMPSIRGTIWLWEKQYETTPVKYIKAVRIMLAEMEQETTDGEVKVADINPTKRRMVKTKDGVKLVEA